MMLFTIELDTLLAKKVTLHMFLLMIMQKSKLIYSSRKNVDFP